jgi:PhnB protein
MQTNLYLHFNGTCEEALKFYEKAAGGKIVVLSTYGDSPAAAHSSPDFHKKIIHSRIQIGDALVMASDAPPERYSKPQGFSVSLSTKTPEEADTIFKALCEGGQVTMPISESFFAHRFGMLIDKFDVPWMVLCQKEVPQ